MRERRRALRRGGERWGRGRKRWREALRSRPEIALDKAEECKKRMLRFHLRQDGDKEGRRR